MTDFLSSFYDALVGAVEESPEEEDPSYVEELKDEATSDPCACDRPGTPEGAATAVVVMEVFTKGALVREAVGLDSRAVGVTLNRGDTFRCVGARDLGHVAPCGTRRVAWRDERAGKRGFVSRKCLRDARWRETGGGAGRARWRVDVDAWRPPLKDAGAEWTLLLSLVSEPDERAKVLQFVHWIDRARALASRLLVRRACEVCLDVDHGAVEVERTKGRKPYLAARAKRAAKNGARCPNFNFNVSHDGRYVVLAAEPRAVVGIDVAAPDKARNDMRPRGKCRRPNASITDLAALEATCVEEDLSHMRESLTAREWAWVQAAAPKDRGLRFRCLWSGKEAFTKARGDGLGFKFERIHIDVADLDDPLRSGRRSFESTVSVDGAVLDDWRVRGEVMEGGHVVSVARGPPRDVQDAQGTFVSTLLAKTIAHSDLVDDADAEFVSLDLGDLVPDDKKGAYRAALLEDKGAHAIAKRKQSMRPYKSTGDMTQLGRIAEEEDKLAPPSLDASHSTGGLGGARRTSTSDLSRRRSGSGPRVLAN